jgi:uncharacterized protein (TIGR03905 family)
MNLQQSFGRRPNAPSAAERYDQGGYVMENYSVKANGTCASQIDFSLENGKLHHIVFHGGCPGNTLAVSKLLEGCDARSAVTLLKGNPCGTRGTSCADQLAKGIEKALQTDTKA